MQPAAAILISVILNVFGQMSLKLGSKVLATNQGGFGFVHLWQVVVKVMSNWHILGGFVLYGLSSIFWLIALSKSDLSYAYPFLSLGYILVIFFSYFLLHEPLSIYRIAGVTCIIIGLLIIAHK
jgi:multidrug transporter EmrE-like cation transporter